MPINNNNTYNKSLELPEDCSLPFFAYGFFKKGELGYHQIENFVNNEPIDGYVSGRLYEKDGVPILKIERQSFNEIKGDIIYFTNPKVAYRSIGKMEPRDLYKWHRVKVLNSTVYANILVYNFENNEHIPGATVSEDGTQGWHCIKDPLFNIGMDYLRYKYFNPMVRQTFKPEEQIDIHEVINNEMIGGYIRTFELQMAYVFLWTIIDRFKTLSYGMTSNESCKNDKLAKSKLWNKAIRYIQDESGEEIKKLLGRVVKSSKTYSEDRLMNKFYGIRCNAVHRGKAVGSDERILTKGFLLLFPIMGYVINSELGNLDVAEKQFYDDVQNILNLKLWPKV